MLDKLLRWKRSAYSDSCKDSSQSSRLSDVFLPSKNMERGYFLRMVGCTGVRSVSVAFFAFYESHFVFHFNTCISKFSSKQSFYGNLIHFVPPYMSTIIWYVTNLSNSCDRKLLQTCLNLELNSKYK